MHIALFFFLWRCGPTRTMSSFLRFLDHTQRHITFGRTPLDEWSAGRRHLCLTKHNPHNRQTSMPPVGFEPTISAGERPPTYALDRVATGVSCFLILFEIYLMFWVPNYLFSFMNFDEFYDTFLSPLHFTVTKTLNKPNSTTDSHHSSRQKHWE